MGLVPTLTPAADIYDDELVVELEVPGFGENELEIEVSNHTLTVKGERKEERETKEKALRLRERLETTFERSFVLPTEADSERLTATYGKVCSRCTCRRQCGRSRTRSRSRPSRRRESACRGATRRHRPSER